MSPAGRAAAPEPAPIRRILIALDATRASEAALEAAAGLAARLEAELLGVFVEDVNLLRLAGLPFAHEVSVALARRRRMESADMERLLRAQARLAEQALAAAARRLRLQATFRVVRGQVAAELQAAAAEADLVALATASVALGGARLGTSAEAMLRALPRPLLMLPPGVRIRAPLATVYDGSPGAELALRLAIQLAQTETDDGLTVLVLADDAESEQRLRAAAEARLAAAGIGARFCWVVEADPAALARAVRAAAAGTLVLVADTPALGAAGVRALLERLECAVLLVR